MTCNIFFHFDFFFILRYMMIACISKSAKNWIISQKWKLIKAEARNCLTYFTIGSPVEENTNTDLSRINLCKSRPIF